MAQLSKELRKLLHEAGWRCHRPAKGDHEIWIDPRRQRTVSIDLGSKSRHTANAVLKRAGLPKAF